MTSKKKRSEPRTEGEGQGKKQDPPEVQQHLHESPQQSPKSKFTPLLTSSISALFRCLSAVLHWVLQTKVPLALLVAGYGVWLFSTPGEFCNANGMMGAVYEGEGLKDFLAVLREQKPCTFDTRALKDVLLGEVLSLIRLKDEVTAFLNEATSELESSENISRFIQKRIKLSPNKQRQEKLQTIAQDVLKGKSEELGQKIDFSKFGDYEGTLNNKLEKIAEGKLMLKNMICSRHCVLKRFLMRTPDDIPYEFFLYIRYLNYFEQEIEVLKVQIDSIKQREDVKTNFE